MSGCAACADGHRNRRRWDNTGVPLGIYISVPFCRSKCSYCNFASGVFAREVFEQYGKRVCGDIRRAEETAAHMGGILQREVDSIYLGGGTPTLLDPRQLESLFSALQETFAISPEAEITVECAPATLTPAVLEALLDAGVNRVSLGVQSFVDEEARAVGRLHTRAAILDDIARLRAAGIVNLNIDLIAGLPHQTPESWQGSLAETIASGAPHVSVYMLEVDEDSRLGREVIAGGTRYHAHFVPNDNLTADLYLQAIELLNAAGISQYEISNFAQPGRESRHNLKYWTRGPYLGFGMDAHSFLPAQRCTAVAPSSVDPEPLDAVRFATPDSLDAYLSGAPLTRTPVSPRQAWEESFFLGLRMNRGVDLNRIVDGHGPQTERIIADLAASGLIDYTPESGLIRLTAQGRLLANEVFERFLS